MFMRSRGLFKWKFSLANPASNPFSSFASLSASLSPSNESNGSWNHGCSGIRRWGRNNHSSQPVQPPGRPRCRSHERFNNADTFFSYNWTQRTREYRIWNAKIWTCTVWHCISRWFSPSNFSCGDFPFDSAISQVDIFNYAAQFNFDHLTTRNIWVDFNYNNYSSL